MEFASIAEAKAFLIEAGAECIDEQRYVYRTKRFSYLQIVKEGLLDVKIKPFRWDNAFIESQGIVIA